MPRPKKSIQMLEAEKKLEAIEAGLDAPKVADQKPIDFKEIEQLGKPRIKAVIVSEELFDVNLANGVKPETPAEALPYATYDACGLYRSIAVNTVFSTR